MDNIRGVRGEIIEIYEEPRDEYLIPRDGWVNVDQLLVYQGGIRGLRIIDIGGHFNLVQDVAQPPPEA